MYEFENEITEEDRKSLLENPFLITNGFQTEMMGDQLLKRRGKQFNITSLSHSRENGWIMSVLSVASNRQQPYLTIVDSVVLPSTDGYMRVVERYCEDLLNLELVDEGDLAPLFCSTIIKVGYGANTKFILWNHDTDECLDMLANESADSSLIWDNNGVVREDVLAYNPWEAQTCSPGQMKKGNITYVAAKNHALLGELKRASTDMVAVWDIVTAKASKYLCTDEDATPKQIAQANARLSAFKAPSAPLGKVRNIAIYMGSVTYQMKKNGDKYKDGFALLSAEYLADLFTKSIGNRFEFSPRACDGRMVQVRPWTLKVLAETVYREYISEVILHNGFETVVLERGKITVKETEAFVETIKSKGKSGAFAGKVVIICDNVYNAWEIDIFTDLEGCKAPFDPNTESELEALAMSHLETDIKHGARTSSQMIQSLMIASPTATLDLLQELNDNLIEEKQELLGSIGRAPSVYDFENNVDFQQVISSVIPQVGHDYYAPLWHSAVDKTVKSITKADRRLNLPMEGATMYVTIDPAADFGQRILEIKDGGRVEVLCTLAEKNNYKELVGIKYPKMAFNEYLDGVVVTIEEYIERVQNNIHLTDRQKQIVIRHIKHISMGAIYIPACEILKKAQAGLDVDGDEMIIVLNPRVGEIFRAIRPIAVVIKEDDVTEPDYLEEILG